MIMSVVKKDRQRVWPSVLAWPDERIDRAFWDMFRHLFTGGLMSDRFAEDWSAGMHLEQFVEDGACVVRAELPGLDPDKDIEVSVADGMLRIQAHREERKEEERPDGYRSEFRYGAFDRSVRLPESATGDDVTASYQDGVLEVRVPAGELVSAPAKIAIEHS
jgi:HSP20 family protein